MLIHHSGRISTILKPLLDSRLPFNEPMSFVLCSGRLEIAASVTEYETPSAINCTNPNECSDVFLGNHAIAARDDQSGLPDSNSRLPNVRLLNCTRGWPLHPGETERPSCLRRKWMRHGKSVFS
jgi:hypothetical protein